MVVVRSFPAVTVMALSLLLPCWSNAELICDTDLYCQEMLKRNTSMCVDGKCSNPFQQGCLKTAGLEVHHDSSPFQGMRICNSDDLKTHANTGDALPCIISPYEKLDYPEVRIHQADWETAIFQAWIHQIVFMEFLGVPSTVGMVTSETKTTGFYSPVNSLVYSSKSYPYDSLETANNVEQCQKTEDPCAHVLPEVWEGQLVEVEPLFKEETVENPVTNGQIGSISWYVPLFTAQQVPQFQTYFGMQGESNRELLAESFKRPTTWLEYCQEVSETKCTISDDTASRYPDSEDEEKLFFKEDEYTGYFRFTESNNCTMQSLCQGYIIGFPCDWSTFMEGQLYWNNIVGLQRYDLDLGGSSTGYVFGQIWRAANATNSHVMMEWYQPDSLIEEFHMTNAEFQQVWLPPPTQECVENRPDTETKCNGDLEAQRGPEVAKCGHDASAQFKLIATYLGEYNQHVDEAYESPAIDVINSLKLSKAQINEILHNWLSIGVDKFGNDAREVVCGWVVDNFDRILGQIPHGFPRKIIQRSDHSSWYLILALALAVGTGCATIMAMALVIRYQKTKAMVFAQPEFVKIILVGHLIQIFGAITVALKPTSVSCILYGWFVFIGYTVELVPVLIKTAAFNKLIRSAQRQKRVNISKKMMLRKVAGIVLLACGFLICWTVFDPATASNRLEVSINDPTVIELEERCSSDSAVWRTVMFLWQALLLFMCAVLAFQSRNALKEINEARTVGTKVYSHFFFMVLRGIFLYLSNTGLVVSSVINALFSLNYSLDVLIAMIIYILPKIVEARNDPSEFRPGRNLTSSGRTSNADNINNDDLKILVCTANLGNKEPTAESMAAWIPPLGGCREVTPLEDADGLSHGHFDLIVIGMQEATWKEKKSRKSTIRGNEISEEEILNALEEHHTAALREMTQDILGEDYGLIEEDCRGQMKLSVWASDRVIEEISDVMLSGANTGIGHVLANKGGIVISLNFKKTRISFVSAHLAAHEGEEYYRHRCDDVRSILREGSTYGLSKKLDVAVSSHHVFFCGDLNFRTNFGNEDERHEVNVKRALELIEAEDYKTLYSFDELHKGVATGDLLVGFETLPCNFPPTFKVEREAGLVYKEQRTPSYTDRILFKSAPGLQSNLTALAYEPCVDFITSDHKPVRGAFSIVPNNKLEVKVYGDIRLTLKDLQCFDLATVKSQIYLTVRWDGVTLAREKKSFRDKLRSLWTGDSWPRTRTASNKNPVWKGEEIALISDNAHLGADAMLYILVMGFDTMGQDEFLGVLPLNPRDLIKGRRFHETFSIDLPLHKDGQHSGRIKFNLDFVAKRTASRRSSVTQMLSLFHHPHHPSPQEAGGLNLRRVSLPALTHGIPEHAEGSKSPDSRLHQSSPDFEFSRVG